MEDEAGGIGELITDQIRDQGVSCIGCTDGHVFTFPSATLQRLLDRAKVKGFVTLFVKHGVQS